MLEGLLQEAHETMSVMCSAHCLALGKNSKNGSNKSVIIRIHLRPQDKLGLSNKRRLLIQEVQNHSLESLLRKL